ncbi:hypothetical protein F5Y16DRAFT_405330 [Xylariaceae sp. FL0255]|nr:hypothetical protein F5Y16DRAFT_405330 [Xylariaceae sp. FL0255]
MRNDLNATLYFLRRDELFKTVKPYSLDFDTEDVPRSNLKSHKVPDLLIKDMRESNYRFEDNGIEMIKYDERMQYEDWFDQKKIEDIYCEDIGRVLMKRLGCSSVQVFDALVRKRHPSFPDSYMDPTIQFQPAVRAHVDSTADAIMAVIRTLHGENAPKMLAKRWTYLNIWKPLKGPLRDWPLTVCDAKTVNPADELVASDTVFANVNRENMMVHHGDKQQWVYISNQMPDELMLFRQVDSQGSNPVPHTSFRLPLQDGEIPEPRESIEARILCFFDD